MKRLLSYIWPITKYIDSAIHGPIEITWINGKKILDSKNTNFSYGSLQRILKFGLSKTDIPSESDILLLGFGGGSVVETLRKDFDYRGKITAVEIDEVMISIAENEFNLKKNNLLDIIAGDAFSYVRHAKRANGLVIIDLFIDKYLSEECYSFNFWNSLAPLVETGGYVVFNVGLDQPNKTKLDQIMEKFKRVFEFKKYENVENTNTLLIGKKIEAGTR